MSAIKDLIRALQAEGLNAGWESTGGGCMAVAVYFGPEVASGYFRYEILITDREDVFSESDYGSDDEVFGFHAGFYVYREDGERECEDVAIHYSPEDADLRSEVCTLVDVVTFVVERVTEADKGRV